MVSHEREHPFHPGEVVLLHGVFCRASHVTMGRARTVLKSSIGMRVAGGVERVLQQVDSIVEEEGVGVAHGHMQLPFKLWTKSAPVADEHRSKVVVVVPIGANLRIDRAGEWIEDLSRVTVGAWRRVNRLPDTPLVGGARVRPQGILRAVLWANIRQDAAVGLAVTRDGNFPEWTFAHEGIGVVVKIDILVSVEVDGIRAGGIRTVVTVGIENLRSKSLPAAGRTAIGCSRPALAYPTIGLLDHWDEFVIQCGTVRSHIGGVDRVGIVIVRIGILNVEKDDAGENACDPILIELVAVLGPQLLVAFGGGWWRRGKERYGSGEVCVVVVLKNHERIAGIGVLVEAVRQQNPGAKVHIATPKLAELVASESDEFEPFRGGTPGRNLDRILISARDGRDDLVERELDGRA